MTHWEFFVENIAGLHRSSRLRVCIGFLVAKLSEKELNCVSQLFAHAQEIGIVARSESEFEEGARAIQRAATGDSRWSRVRMVSADLPDDPLSWDVYTDIWLEGRY